MIKKIEFQNFKKDLHTIVDLAQNCMPLIILPQNSSKENIVILNESILKELLKPLKFDLRLTDEVEGAYAYWLGSFNTYGYGNSKNEALSSLLEEVVFTIENFINHPNSFFDKPNNRTYIPYIFKIALLCENEEEIKQLLLNDAS